MCSRCMLMRTPSVIARLSETELLRDGVVTTAVSVWPTTLGKVSETSRIDGRRLDQLRDVRIERGWLSQAEGSVLVSFGRTTVLCNASVTEGSRVGVRDPDWDGSPPSMRCFRVPPMSGLGASRARARWEAVPTRFPAW